VKKNRLISLVLFFILSITNLFTGSIFASNVNIRDPGFEGRTSDQELTVGNPIYTLAIGMPLVKLDKAANIKVDVNVIKTTVGTQDVMVATALFNSNNIISAVSSSRYSFNGAGSQNIIVNLILPNEDIPNNSYLKTYVWDCSNVAKTFNKCFRFPITSSSINSSNIAVNAGFEDGANGWVLNDSCFKIVSEQTEEGLNSLKITSNASEQSAYQDITVTPNTDYVMSFYANCSEKILYKITDTSNADTASSQIISFGSTDRARAIPIR